MDTSSLCYTVRLTRSIDRTRRFSHVGNHKKNFKHKVCIIGGCGHVGLPLALMFADEGIPTVIFDIDFKNVEMVKKGLMPFEEDGAPDVLKRVLKRGTLEISSTPDPISECGILIYIIGTPVDEHLNPDFSGIYKGLEGFRHCLRPGQIIVLRSTVYPGVSDHLQRSLREENLDIRVAFCPERVAQGKSLKEFRSLPQIISAFEESTLQEMRELFSCFTDEIIEMAPMEAEFAKLMTNAWRYAQFAIVNQFYMIATRQGLNFDRILHACRYKYPRTNSMPNPGFAAGPCLVKDTMQLAAFSQNNFILGQAAMMINEGLPMHLVKLAEGKGDLREKTAGILGMSFKAESDDIRDSLSFKLRKILKLRARHILCSDPFVKDDRLVPEEEVLSKAEVLFIGVPHQHYKELNIPDDKIIIDPWNCVKARVRSDSV